MLLHLPASVADSRNKSELDEFISTSTMMQPNQELASVIRQTKSDFFKVIGSENFIRYQYSSITRLILPLYDTSVLIIP